MSISTRAKTYTAAAALTILASTGAVVHFTVPAEGVGPVESAITGEQSARYKRAFLDFAMSADDFRTVAYPDSGGVWTICYGTTIYPDGRRVQRGDTATREQCEQYIEHHYETRVYPVMISLLGDVCLPLMWYAGIADHVYNNGRLKGTNVLRAARARDCAGLAAAFKQWTKVRKHGVLVFEPGLLNRAMRRVGLLKCGEVEFDDSTCPTRGEVKTA
ncbi:MAG: hypothetical protein LBR05_01050 [Azoarcus sp.]|jgi:lysozyme|nr:hypothetical protein [Azoarcus sp.]